MIQFDVVVNVSVYNMHHGASFMSAYNLSLYQPSETETPFQQLKKEVLQKSKDLQVNWVGVSLVLNGFAILTTKGNLDWFQGVEFFKKYISDGGSSDLVNQPDGFGLVDQTRKIRVEFEKGQVVLLPV